MYDYENQAYLEKLNSKPAVWFEDVLQQVGAAASEKVLELGCGDGALSRLLAASGRDVLSVDYSQTFINHAKKYNKVKNNSFRRFNLDKQHVTELGGDYDTVVIMDVLEHIKRRREVLDEVFSVLRPGGQLVLQCPNLYCNVVSTNYRHSVKNILIKTGRAWKGWWRYLLHRPIPEPEELRAGLDWLFADDDAVVLTSPYWFLDYFKRRSDWELRHYTSWSFATEKRWVKRILAIGRFIPFLRFLGGKMVFRVRKPFG